MRQESRFAKNAQSSAGALGIMQLMPGTARNITAKMGKIHSDDSLLTSNLRYNITLGIGTIKESLDYYNNSLIPSIASYNAGIHNVNKWLKTMSDIRNIRSMEERINWMESIPFHETRDYVIRVLENMVNYMVISNQTQKVDILKNYIMS
jgi:soluble lytic murein transglycosylase